MIRFLLRLNEFSTRIPLLLVVLIYVVNIVVLLKRIIRRSKELEITENKIKINHIEVPIEQIEKIIIQGYFIQSVGIKLYRRKFVSGALFFRFKNNEEKAIAELKQWAEMNDIKVTSGSIRMLY